MTYFQASGIKDAVRRNAMQNAQVAAPVRWAVITGATALFLSGPPLPAQVAQNVTLIWNANTDPSISGYRLYYGTQSGNYSYTSEIGDVTTATVSNLTPGQTYYFVVTDFDTAGLESLPSNEVSYTAVAANAPAVSLSVTPSTGQRFVVPVSLVLTASASETGGSITRVEFYNSGTYLGEATAPPYTLTLNHPPAGNYSLTATAFDDQNLSATSAAVGVTMTLPPSPRLTP